MKKKVFISYSHDDTKKYEKLSKSLAESLKKIDLVPWLDIEKPPSVPETITNQISSAIESCEIFLLIWTDHSSKDRWQMRECSYILERYWKDLNQIIIPIRVGDATLPSWCSNFKYIDFSDDQKHLTHGIKLLVESTAESKSNIRKFNIKTHKAKGSTGRWEKISAAINELIKRENRPGKLW